MQFVIQGHWKFRIQICYDKTTQNLKQVILKTLNGHCLVFIKQQNWSLLGHCFAIFQWIPNLGTLETRRDEKHHFLTKNKKNREKNRKNVGKNTKKQKNKKYKNKILGNVKNKNKILTRFREILKTETRTEARSSRTSQYDDWRAKNEVSVQALCQSLPAPCPIPAGLIRRAQAPPPPPSTLPPPPGHRWRGAAPGGGQAEYR